MRDIFAPLVVELDAGEVHESVDVAEQRRWPGLEDKHGYVGPSAKIDIPGALAEQAWCKGMGVPWPKSVGTFKLPDYGDRIQIRMAPCKWYPIRASFGTLIVRPDDNPGHRFTLVTGVMPNYFILLGWIEGVRARDKGWERREANRPPAWFIPHKFLHKNLSDILR